MDIPLSRHKSRAPSLRRIHGSNPSVHNSDSALRFCTRKRGKGIMRRQEKKRKFHEAVLNMLYPPPPSPPSPQVQRLSLSLSLSLMLNLCNDRRRMEMGRKALHPEDFKGTEFQVRRLASMPNYEGGNEVRGSSASDADPEDNEGECGEQKLTRAQRKRIRKKKLKEETARRRKIVGPLLPSSSSGGCSTKEDDPGGVKEKEPPGVRRNAELGSDDVPHEREESAAFINQKRIKHRRAAKKLARDRLKLSEQENNN